MTYSEFKKALFNKRGEMKGVDTYIKLFVDNSIIDLQVLVANTKKLGIKRMSEIASSCNELEQHKFVQWLESNKTAKKKDIEAYLLGL